jgi:hypothetical protein
VNPDFIELKDGRILLAYQWRYKNGYSDIPNTNNNCGIMIAYSNNKGKTFEKSREIYRGRCWEPALLQLPSGEIQMYITSSQDVVNNTSYPRTIVIRSFDGGKTWQGKKLCGINDNETISRTVDERFAYDGMPSGVWLDDNNGIAVPLEVWSGKLIVDQTPIIVKTSVEDNWKTKNNKIIKEGGPEYPNKKQINKDFYGFGPYSTKLHTGEVVVLSNGWYKGIPGIWTFIGDKKADNFTNATSPFDGYWGSIDYIGENKVVATGTVRYKKDSKPRGLVRTMIGRLNYSKKISKNNIDLMPLEKFNKDNNNCWFLGKKFNSSVFSDFGYTDKNFIWTTYLFDNKLTAFTTENSDASVILLSRDGEQQYKIVVNAKGNYIVYEEDNMSWHLIDKGTVDDIKVVGTINNDSDKDMGFASKLSIPWKLIGGDVRVGEKIYIHLAHHYKEKSVEKPVYSFEELEGENSDYPTEWLNIELN